MSVTFTEQTFLECLREQFHDAPDELLVEPYPCWGGTECLPHIIRHGDLELFHDGATKGSKGHTLVRREIDSPGSISFESSVPSLKFVHKSERRWRGFRQRFWSR
jgi:hypothetical protein